MRALTTIPLSKDTLELTDLPDPSPGDGELLVDGIAVGVCGTDKEIAAGE
jgi:D-arabinose 1-dehydrogenase-like Zn-dependent alcohol dehydrogenase